MPEVLTTPIEIACPGIHTAFQGFRVPMSAGELKAAVTWFNSSGTRIPMVVAHPADESRPLGFGTKLAMTRGDRVSIVEAEAVDPTFRAIVNSGELNRISAKVRLPGHPKNRSDGFEFQHVGFFGRSRVAMEQLKEAAFSQNDKEFYLMTVDLDEKEAEFRQKEADFASRLAALEEKEAKAKALEADFKRRQEFEPQIEKWLADGKLLPVEKPKFVALFAALPDELEVSFSAATGNAKASARKILSDFITNLKPRITYGEVVRGDVPGNDDRSASFGGMNVSEESDAMDKKVCAHCKKNGMDENNPDHYAKALKAVGGT